MGIDWRASPCFVFGVLAMLAFCLWALVRPYGIWCCRSGLLRDC